MADKIALILIAVLAVLLGSLFGGAETGMYRLSRLRLRLGVEKRRLSFVILGKLAQDGPALLLSMLVGNNLAHYVATGVVTYLFLSQVGTGHTAEIYATLITAPALFVFSELIPKNLFFYRADRLVPHVAFPLYASHKVFTWCGVVPLLGLMSRIFAHATGSDVPSKSIITAAQRHHMRAIFQDSREEGVLSSVQSDIVNRLVSISGIRVRSVMTPLGQVRTAELGSDRAALLDILRSCPFSRLPVVDGGPTNVIGYVNIYEVLACSEQFDELRSFTKPIKTLDANTTVSDAIEIMRSEHEKIILVTRATHAGQGKPIGIVTMKDLVEELFGELAEW
ncbi:MAG: DUF21 domain-containing protein [Phycisphaerales bacterium]|nr:MAG: DUF21 domain-containing protein [Phycisphaerales bacterium]